MANRLGCGGGGTRCTGTACAVWVGMVIVASFGLGPHAGGLGGPTLLPAPGAAGGGGTASVTQSPEVSPGLHPSSKASRERGKRQAASPMTKVLVDSLVAVVGSASTVGCSESAVIEVGGGSFGIMQAISSMVEHVLPVFLIFPLQHCVFPPGRFLHFLICLLGPHAPQLAAQHMPLRSIPLLHHPFIVLLEMSADVLAFSAFSSKSPEAVN